MRLCPSPRLYACAVAALGLSVIPACRSRDAGEAPRAPEAVQVGSLTSAPTCEFRSVASSAQAAQFTTVEAIDVDGQGNIYVADPRKGAVTVLAPDGSLLRTIGRKGKGPGEFDYVRNVQVLPGDSLLVFDHGLFRTTVFAPGSDQVAYVVNHAEPALTPPNWVERVPGRPVLLATYRDAVMAGANGAGDAELKQGVRLLDAHGALVRDSVLVTPASNDMLIARQGGDVAVTSNPFGRPSRVRVGPDGRIYYGRGDSLAIGIYSLEGRRVGGFAVRHTPPEVTDGDLDAAVDANRGNSMVMNAMREQAPERWPAFRNFVVDDRGRIWVGVVTPAEQPTRWVAFDAAGKAVCSAELPPGVDLKTIRGGRAYGVQTDEMDVPRVVAYTVTERS